MPRTPALFVALSVAMAIGPAPLAAQTDVRFSASPQWEVRLDATAAQRLATHAGLGLNLRAGPYVRVGFGIAGGAVRTASDEWVASQRADLAARFLLDPFAERARGLYGGAGISARRDGDESVVGHLVLLFGIEGRPTRALVPSLEIALGGGTRVGVVLRRRRAEPAR